MESIRSGDWFLIGSDNCRPPERASNCRASRSPCDEPVANELKNCSSRKLLISPPMKQRCWKKAIDHDDVARHFWLLDYFVSLFRDRSRRVVDRSRSAAQSG